MSSNNLVARGGSPLLSKRAVPGWGGAAAAENKFFEPKKSCKKRLGGTAAGEQTKPKKVASFTITRNKC